MLRRFFGRPSGLLACALLGACDHPIPEPQQPWVPVRIETAGSAAASGSVRYSAVVTPKAQVNLAFKVGGYVDSILQHPAPGGGQHLITQGETVSRDQVLATITDDEYRDKVKAAEADLASANAALVKGKADFKRAKALYKTQSMTAPDYDSAQQEYQTAEANVSAASAQLDGARLNLSYCQLKAPMNALVLKRNIEVGTLVEPGTQAFDLADMSEVKVLFAVPDVMLKNLSVGDSMSISTRSLPGQNFGGLISSISPVADSQTRVFDIELTVPNPEGLWKDGMVAALSVAEAVPVNTPSITVPISAVVGSRTDLQDYALYVVTQQDDKAVAQRRAVKLGEVRGNRVVVLDGITVGAKVVVSGVNTVRDGGQVRILP